MLTLQSGDRIHLVDRKARHYALTLKAGETFQLSGEKIAHDAIIGRPDGSIVTLARGRRMLAVRPTLGEYVLKMPRGAQVIYPKDLAMITIWADIYPGAKVFEAGTGSGALTMALLRAVGHRGSVVTYEAREDFARTAATNIQRYMGEVPNLRQERRDVAICVSSVASKSSRNAAPRVFGFGAESASSPVSVTAEGMLTCSPGNFASARSRK